MVDGWLTTIVREPVSWPGLVALIVTLLIGWISGWWYSTRN